MVPVDPRIINDGFTVLPPVVCPSISLYTVQIGLCTENRQILYHQCKKRRDENHAVEPVERAAVAGHDIAVVFDAVVPLNQRERQVARYGNYRAERGQHERAFQRGSAADGKPHPAG